MKRRTALALLAAAVAAAPAGARSTAAEIRRWTGPEQSPPLGLRDLDGRPLSLESFAGKVLLVNFWATWCEPCVEEMPSLQRLRDRLDGARFEVLAVNYMEGEPRIRAFVQRVPVRFPIVRDTDGAVAKAWGARVFPSSFLLDAAHRRRYVAAGSLDWAGPTTEPVLRELLDGPRR